MRFTKKINSIDFLSNIYIYYILFSSYSVYMLFLFNASVVQLGTLIFSLFLIFAIKKGTINKNLLLFPIILSLLFLGASLMTTRDSVATALALTRFLTISYCVFALYKKKKNLCHLIYECLFSLMVFYFLCYMIFDIFMPDLGLSHMYDDVTNLDGISTYRLFENHFNFYIRWATSVTFLGFDIKRMCGFCWEAGQYQIYLNFILMYLLFFKDNNITDRYRVMFTLLNIALCGSTMGIIVAVFLLTTKAVIIGSGWKRLVTAFPYIVIGCGTILYFVNMKSMDAVYSYTTRTSELYLIYDIFFKNNILGGANVLANPSNGLVRFLWAYGYLALMVLILFIICIVNNKNLFRFWHQKIVFLVWFILSLLNEPIEYFNFTFFIFAIVMADTFEHQSKSFYFRLIGATL